MTVSLLGCGGSGSSETSAPVEPSQASVSIADANATSYDTSVTVPLALNAAQTVPVSVAYTTVDDTATSPADYVFQNGTLTFEPGQVSQAIIVSLSPNRDTATTRSFHIKISDPVNAVITDDTADITLEGISDTAVFDSSTFNPDWGVLGVFTNAVTCNQCHTAQGTVMTVQGRDVSPTTTWRHSSMAQSLNDPYFQAAVEEESHVYPGFSAQIEDTCMSCHAPMGYTQYHRDHPESDSHYAFHTAMGENIAREGVSCTACHQIKDRNLGTIAAMSGQYSINTDADRDGNGRLPSYGPYVLQKDYPVMRNKTQYQQTYGSQMTESKMCATCHNLYTPTIDFDGNPVTYNGTTVVFAEQTPYWEWLNSIYPAQGKSCQSCHMAEPVPGYLTAITTTPSGATQHSPFAVHDMVGGNTQLLAILKQYRNVLGITNSTTASGFETKIAETRTLLGKAATLTIGQIVQANGKLTVPVTITNLTGHKLPTSYPSRRMWIHLKVTDSSGQTIFESGKTDSAGRLAADSSFTSRTCLEIIKPADFSNDGCYAPHHDVITSPQQTQIYESILGDNNGDITHVLIGARSYLKDNRIPPMGYRRADLPSNPVEPIKDADVIGVDNDPNFATGYDSTGADGKDTVTYMVPTTATSGPYQITVDLEYQSIKPSFVSGLHANEDISGDSYVGRFKTMYQAVPPAPELMATDNRTY